MFFDVNGLFPIILTKEAITDLATKHTSEPNKPNEFIGLGRAIVFLSGESSQPVMNVFRVCLNWTTTKFNVILECLRH